MGTVNWAEWVQAIAALISAGVAIVLIKQLSLAKNQLNVLSEQLSLAKNQLALTQDQVKLGVDWNRLSAAFTFFSVKTFTEYERAAVESLSKLSVDLYHQKGALPADIVQAVLQDTNLFREIKSLLNFLEDYAAAVHTTVMDSDVSYKLMSDVVTRYYEIFRPLMEARRKGINNPRLWLEFEKLALIWEPKRVAEEQLLRDEVEKARLVSKVDILKAEEKAKEYIRQAEEKAKKDYTDVLTKVGTLGKRYGPNEP